MTTQFARFLVGSFQFMDSVDSFATVVILHDAVTAVPLEAYSKMSNKARDTMSKIFPVTIKPLDMTR